MYIIALCREAHEGCGRDVFERTVRGTPGENKEEGAKGKGTYIDSDRNKSQPHLRNKYLKT